MASVDGAHSMKMSSQEDFTFECNPCEFDGLRKQAIFFCAECRDYLCESCELSHKKFSSTRKHTIVSCSSMPKGRDPLKEADFQSTVLCSCNKKEVTVYWKDHNTVVCVDCESLEHRSCQMSLISDASAGFEQITADQTLKSLKEIVDKLTPLQKSRTKDFQKLNAKTNKCIENVKAFKNELIAQLNLMEEQTLADLDKYDSQQRKIIEHHINACNVALTRAISDQMLLEDANETSEKVIQFIRNVQLSKHIDNLSTLLSDIENEVHEPNLTFDRDESLKRIYTNGLGIVKGSSSETKVPEAKKLVSDMKIRSSRKVDIKLPHDNHNPYISGSVFLPTGELVLCDNYNKKIKVFNENITPKEHIELKKPPWDVSLVTDTEVVTTLRVNHKLQFIQALPKLSFGDTVQLDKECCGIAVYDSLFFISFYDGEVRSMDRSGQMQKSIFLNQDTSFRFKNPLYLAVSKTGRLYVSENTMSPVIYCMSLDGTNAFTYRVSGLKICRGMLVDAGENVMVCGRESNNVHAINQNGHKIKVLLSASDGLQYPNTTAFKPYDNILVVGGDAEYILACDME